MSNKKSNTAKEIRKEFQDAQTKSHGGHISRNWQYKTDNEKETSNLFYVVDSERKSDSDSYLSQQKKLLNELCFAFGDDIAEITDNFTSLVLPENENGNKYARHINIGRKVYGKLEYFPTTACELAKVISCIYSIVNEKRLFDAEISRTAKQQQNTKKTVQSMDASVLLGAMTDEQKAQLLAMLTK